MTHEVLEVIQIEQLVSQCDGESLVEQVVTTELLEVAEQGPPGPPGPPGSILHAAIAATAIGGHRAVLVLATGAVYADNTTEAHAGRVAGVTVGAASMGAQVSFQSSGRLVEPSWTWTPEVDIWLGTAGQLTQTYPAAAVFVQRMGYAISPTEMWIDSTEPTFH